MQNLRKSLAGTWQQCLSSERVVESGRQHTVAGRPHADSVQNRSEKIYLQGVEEWSVQDEYDYQVKDSFAQLVLDMGTVL